MKAGLVENEVVNAAFGTKTDGQLAGAVGQRGAAEALQKVQGDLDRHAGSRCGGGWRVGSDDISHT